MQSRGGVGSNDGFHFGCLCSGVRCLGSFSDSAEDLVGV